MDMRTPPKPEISVSLFISTVRQYPWLFIGLLGFHGLIIVSQVIFSYHNKGWEAFLADLPRIFMVLFSVLILSGPLVIGLIFINSKICNLKILLYFLIFLATIAMLLAYGIRMILHYNPEQFIILAFLVPIAIFSGVRLRQVILDRHLKHDSYSVRNSQQSK